MSLKTSTSLLSVLSLSIALSLIGKIAMASQSENSAETDGHKLIKVTGEAYIGAHHDSNVNVSELDTNTDTSDSAIKGNAKLKLALMPTDKWQFSARRVTNCLGLKLAFITITQMLTLITMLFSLTNKAVFHWPTVRLRKVTGD